MGRFSGAELKGDAGTRDSEAATWRTPRGCRACNGVYGLAVLSRPLGKLTERSQRCGLDSITDFEPLFPLFSNPVVMLGALLFSLVACGSS